MKMIRSPLQAKESCQSRITEENRCHYWDRRFEQFGSSRGSFKAICSYGMPYVYNKYIDVIQRKSICRALDSLNIRGKRVLDIGCGNGRWCRILSDRGAKVTGIDISGEAIEQARILAGDRDIHFVHSDVSELDFAPGSFDLITSVTVLQHVIDMKTFSRSIGKITDFLSRPGKVLIMEVAPSAAQIQKHSTSVLSVRTDRDYADAFKINGAELEDVFTVDVASLVQKQLIPATERIPRTLFNALVYPLVMLSFPVDYFLAGSRILTKESWHKVFLFSMKNP